MTTLQGDPGARGLRIGLIAARFNDALVQRLIGGAVNALLERGAASENVTLIRVPGAYELPQACRRMAASGRYDALVALGVVVRGATAHFDYVVEAAATGIRVAMHEQDVPIGFGVLAVDTVAQALERSGEQDNRGAEAALAAVEMANLLRELDGS